MFRKRIPLLAAALALVGTTLGASTAVGATQHDVRESDFIAGISDTRSAGHVDFLKEGLHVYTDDNSSNAKAAEYFAPPNDEIPTSGSYDWYGTDNQPGSQIVFDTNSDRSDAGSFNVLVGEQVYTPGAGDGDNLTDWWYPGGTTRAAERGITCPSTTGGSGSDCHGTLQQWHDGVPTAEVYAYGFSLGSGLKGDGVLRSLTYGNDEYVFTDADAPVTCPPAPTTEDVSASSTLTKSGRVVTADFVSQPLGANAKQGAKVTWSVRIDSKTAAPDFFDQMGAGEHAYYKYRAPAGKHTVYVTKNGSVVREITVNP